MRLVAVDVGGTHARFAIAECASGERPVLGATRRYSAADHKDLPAAWRHFAADLGEPLPDAACVAVAAPLGEPVVRFTNSSWSLDTGALKADLGVGRLSLINDFGAVAHAVAATREEELVHIHGPSGPLPAEGVTSVMGLGTGLGVAILRRDAADYQVIETEGAHAGFAPTDAEDEAIAWQLRHEFGRVSIERLVSGPGLVNIARALAAADASGVEVGDAQTLWADALDGSDPLAVRALDRLLMAFGTAAGDLALAHGSNAVVLTGSLANRMIDRLRGARFVDRFCAKGRYRDRMERIAVRTATHAEAGLLGAAIAFQREFGG
jgi:glucokinase